MTEKLLMAIDLGTSFVKAGVYNLEGSCIAQAKEPVQDERPAPGIFIQRGEALAESVIRCIQSVTKQLGNDAEAVEAISFTGQMSGFMGVDENWKDVTGWSCSLDTRYAPYADRQLQELKDEFLEISGTNSPLFSAKYEWFRDAFPEEEKRIAKYLIISSFIIGKLGDVGIEEAAIDGSLITWTGLADVKNRQWSAEICERLGVDRSRLPRIVESTEVVAHLSKETARLTGLRCGIPLVAGAGDKVTGCVGAANLRKGGLLYEAASFGGISFLVDDYRPDYEKRHFDLLNGSRAGDLYAHYYMPGSGLTLDWYLQNFVDKNRPLGELYREMDERMATVPAGSEGLMAVGMLSGTVMPFDPSIKGVWLGHTLAHRPEHFYRALGESFGYALAGAVSQMEAIYPEWKPDYMRIIGGGARSENMNQLLADVMGKPVQTIEREDNALWGACILAAKGIGMIGDMAAFAEEHVRVKRVYEPDEKNHEIYRKLTEKYQHCLQTVAPLMK